MRHPSREVLLWLPLVLVAVANRAFAQDRIHSIRSHAFEGASLAALGDVDGDGMSDLAVHHDIGGIAVRVVSGFSGAVLFELPDFGNNATTGIPMGDAGDVDGDGVHDLVVGYVLSIGHTVSVFSGRTGAEVLAIPLPAALINQPSTFGYAVAGAGDVNGDGRADLLVGAPALTLSFAGQQFTGSGRVYVVSGLDGSILLTTDAPLPSIEFGAAVDRIGDVDGDSIDDFGVGARGHAFVVSGANGAILRSFASGAADEFGLAITGIGDLDGDSRPDFVIGAPDTVQGGPGGVSAFSSATGALLWHVAGANTGAALGQSVRRLPDADGDGVEDVLAGAPGPFFPPTATGAVHAISGRSGATLFRLLSGPGDIRYGFFVEGLADANGDGVADLALTTLENSTFNARLDIYSSRDLALVTGVDSLSLGLGGTQTMAVAFGPSAASELYLVVGSASGIRPGFLFDSHLIPLNIDPYFVFSLDTLGIGLIQGALGTLDSGGNAQAAFVLPALAPPWLAGVVLEHAAVTWNGVVTNVSNAATLRLTQ